MRNAVVLAALAATSLAACSSTKPATVGPGRTGAIGTGPVVASAPPRKPIGRPSTARAASLKIGAPYQVRGVWYVPADQPGYVEEGVASWYGEELAGRRTANGEPFDANLFTGAHTTLPMPGRVEVTNLENGRTLELRLNDRGPFLPGRLIDVSRAAAEELGFRTQGQARVRVRYLGPADGLIAPLRPSRPTMTVASASLPMSKPMRPATATPASAAAAYSSRPTGATAAAGAWTVQAGSFSVSDNAARAAKTLSPAGQTQVRTVEADGRTFYRVLVGPWSDAAAAHAARQEVAALGFADARVIAAAF